jgi:D-psicose/D-tagatose/L-ribulose 3-epimerase
MKIKLAVSTWLWTSPFTSESVSLFPKIKRMGYDAVEIPVEDPELIDGEKVKKALEENGLEAVVCGAFGPTRDLTNEDTAMHLNCFKYIEASMKLCNTWNADIFVGPMYSAVGKARMVPPEQRKREWELAVKNLKKVCDMAASHGLQIALEPLNRFESDLVNTAKDVVKLINDINHSAAKVLLDGFHMNIEEPDIQEAIKLAGDKLVHVQVSENYRGTPGTGQTRWQDYKKGLEAINYRGVISIESFTPEIKELAGAVCIWRPLVPDQDEFASEGLKFLQNLFFDE